MADGLAITPGTGAIAATDEITTENGVGVSARHAQRIKLDIAGVDGAFTDLSAANPLPVSGAFFQATQPVSIAASVAVTGPLTDTQLRLTAVPVSGAFFQATQPVSAASLPLPTGAATETTLAALNTKVTAVNTGAVTISAALPAGAAVIGALIANQSANVAQMNGVAVTMGSGVTGTGVQRVVMATDVALPTGANSIGTTPGPTLTKGTQGTVGHSTQDLKDAGRAIVNAATAVAGVTCVTAEALLALNISRDGAATASATSHAVTAAKRWRVTGMIASVRSTGATVLSGRVCLRFNPSGAATATSPIIAIASMTQQAAALAEAGDTCVLTFSEGIEFSGANQLALSQVCSAITGVVYASLIGYEY